jgi:hypothetical protein
MRRGTLLEKIQWAKFAIGIRVTLQTIALPLGFFLL